MSLCQALVRIVLLTAGLVLLPCSLSPLGSSSPVLFSPFFVCAALSAFLDGFCHGEFRRRRGSLVRGPTFRVFPCAWIRMLTHTHKGTIVHVHRHTNTHQWQ